MDHVERVRRGEHPDAHERRTLSVEPDIVFVVLGAEHDVSNLAKPDNRSLLFLHHQLTELFGCSEVRIRDEVHGNHRALGLAERRQVVVALERVADGGRRDPERSHLVRLQPHPHRERTVAENIRALYAADGAQLRLHDPRQIVRNLVLIKVGGRKPDVHRRELRVRGFQLDDRCFGLWRQIVAHLGHLGLDLRERCVGVVVQLQVHRDRGHAVRAGRLHIVDAIRAGDHALERRRDESANEVGIRTHVHRADLDDRNVAARILPDAERANRLEPRDQNDQIDDDRQHGTFDEQISETHGVPLWLNCLPVSGRDYSPVSPCC